jgi:Na+ dependent nucleoside transporter N-terminus
MVQVLGRLAVSAGVLTVSGLSGWLANFMRRQDVFLVGLIVPAISVAGVFLRGTETKERRPIDWRILGGGIAFGIVVAVGVSGVPFGQEIIFVISMAVVSYMLVLVTAELDHDTRVGILFAAIIVFAFRAAPRVGDGFFWWTLDELKFDAAFYGTLRQTGAILSIALILRWCTGSIDGPKLCLASAPAALPSLMPQYPRRFCSSAWSRCSL